MTPTGGPFCLLIALIATANPITAPGDEPTSQPAAPPEPYAEVALAVDGMV